MTRRRPALVLGVVLVVAVGIVIGVVVLRPSHHGHGGSVAGQPMQPGDRLEPRTFCSTGATSAFRPTSISIRRVASRAPVLALPRVGDVPGTPPLDDAGKHEFAWDRPPGISPGSAHGNVLLNAHTWPWDAAPALGNLMLEHLHVHDRIVVRGAHAHLCYRVTKQVQVNAAAGYPAYYATKGRPQLAIIVCSGVRAGPGDWLSRTIWFATPITGVTTTRATGHTMGGTTGGTTGGTERSEAGPRAGSTT